MPNPKSNKPDLEFFTVQELTAEIFKRSTACVVMRLYETPTPDPSKPREESFELLWRGGANNCLGMATRAQGRMLELCNSGPVKLLDNEEGTTDGP